MCIAVIVTHYIICRDICHNGKYRKEEKRCANACIIHQLGVSIPTGRLSIAKEGKNLLAKRDFRLKEKGKEKSLKMSDTATVELASGHRMPIVGFGTWQVSICYNIPL